MTPSIAARSEGVISAAASARGGMAATNAQTIASGANDRRNGIATTTPAKNVYDETGSELIGSFDFLRLALDFLGAVIRGGVLLQQRLGAAGLLCCVLLLAGGEPFLGER